MATKKEDTTDVTTVDQTSAGLPAELMDDIADSGVLGYSEKSEDTLIPILSILQDNSGEVKKNHSKRIDGAEPGMMIIRSLGMIFDGEEEGISFQPCGFQHAWVQWNGEPGDGAVVAQYPFEERPKEAELKTRMENGEERQDWEMPNGDRLVETRYHVGHLLRQDEAPLPCVIPMGGTNHTVSRQWTALMRQFRMPGRNTKAPGFMRSYRLLTKFNQRGSQSWYKYAVTDEGWIQDAQLIRDGLDMAKMVEEDKITVDTSEGEAPASSGSSDEMPI